MTNFYIKELSLSGNNVETSSIEFTPGVNIVYGKSNTGKSYILDCLNFMFGLEKNKFRIGKDTGYDTVHLQIETLDGQLYLQRKFDENSFILHSTNKNIKSGKYGLKDTKLNINDFWLSLMGITTTPRVIATEGLKRKNLTLRSFLHTFLISETSILKEDSILLLKNSFNSTYIISVLFYLMTGNAFEDDKEVEDKKIKEAKKEAISSYVQNILNKLNTRKTKLSTYDAIPLENIQATINSILSEISETENTLTTALSKSKSISKEIYALNEKLAESNMLLNHYNNLSSQYDADLDRLTFIVEGELISDDFPKAMTCPLCNCTQKDTITQLSIESVQNESKSLIFKRNELEEVKADVNLEIRSYEVKSENLRLHRKKIETLINSELKPKIDNLKKALNNYKLSIEIQKEASVLNKLETSMVNDLTSIITSEEDATKFKAKEHLKGEPLDNLRNILNQILNCCNFQNLLSSNFDLASFDVQVNLKEKRTYGKGYRAFLNTILALTLREYLDSLGKFSPGVFIIDSPILSLKEQGDEKAPDTMKASLFKFLVNNKSSTQTIIIENDIPNIDYKNTNLIYFTKDKNKGRYGFLKSIK